MSELQTHTPRTVGILIFENVEVLDFCGPFEVFSLAQPRDEWSSQHFFKVVTIAEEDQVISCSGGLQVKPHYAITNHPPLDILLIPGGAGVMQINENERVLDWIAVQAEQVEITSSVCTGSLLLARRGLLDGKRATSHWSSIGWFREHYPSVTVVDDARFVDEGHIITSAGVSAGIDMALNVVERLHGSDVATWTARVMEYDAHSR